MELYYRYQPVTWHIGVIEAAPEAVADVIQLYMPDDILLDIRSETGTIEEALANMEPLGPRTKFFLIETRDGRTGLFDNSFAPSGIELPTWYATGKLGVSSHYICNVPNTISCDHRSGAYGARKIEFRTANNPITQEPVFGVQVINDAGRWCFYRFGEKRDFEDEKAYKAFRKPNRFTVEMLVKYCHELGIPVYDRDFYSNNWIVIERKLRPDEKGISYQEAAVKFRIKQDN